MTTRQMPAYSNELRETGYRSNDLDETSDQFIHGRPPKPSPYFQHPVAIMYIRGQGDKTASMRDREVGVVS
jgi:hypothetical protein